MKLRAKEAERCQKAGMDILPVVWFDISTVDFERAVKFYSTLLGDVVTIDRSTGSLLGFLPMQDDRGIGGTLVPATDGRTPGDGARIYISCEGILDEVARRAQEAGGTVVRPKFSLGKAGWFVLIKDTEGNTLGLQSFT